MAEHVSFFRLKAKPRKRNAVVRHFEKWEREQRRHAPGARGGVIVGGYDDPNELMGVVRWDTKRGYFANANRPQQDAWYRELLELLEGEPEWFDGALLHELRAGRRRS